MNGVSNNKNCKIPLLVIAGPTAAGKTELAIKIAEKTGGEIISADSVQVYRYLDIGSAKPTQEEKKGIPHHMLDLIDPDEDFTVFDYQTMAGKCISEIHAAGKLPILAGGTGLYIKALIDGYTFRSGRTDPSIRSALKDDLDAFGKEFLYRKLRDVDPAGCDKLHINDTKRIIRALEYYYLTGEPISTQQQMTKQSESPYLLTMIGLSPDRDILYERINHRVNLMLQKGLLDEVESLLKRGYREDLKSMQSMGYRHVINYLQKKWKWNEAVAFFKQDTRKFAKRQMTWFRSDSRINWIKIGQDMEMQSVLESIYRKMAGY